MTCIDKYKILSYYILNNADFYVYRHVLINIVADIEHYVKSLYILKNIYYSKYEENYLELLGLDLMYYFNKNYMFFISPYYDIWKRYIGLNISKLKNINKYIDNILLKQNFVCQINIFYGLLIINERNRFIYDYTIINIYPQKLLTKSIKNKKNKKNRSKTKYYILNTDLQNEIHNINIFYNIIDFVSLNKPYECDFGPNKCYFRHNFNKICISTFFEINKENLKMLILLHIQNNINLRKIYNLKTNYDNGIFTNKLINNKALKFILGIFSMDNKVNIIKSLKSLVASLVK